MVSVVVIGVILIKMNSGHWAKKEISYVSYFLKVGISYTNQVEDRAKCPTYMTFSSILYLIGVGNTNFQEEGHIGNFFFRPVGVTSYVIILATMIILLLLLQLLCNVVLLYSKNIFFYNPVLIVILQLFYNDVYFALVLRAATIRGRLLFDVRLLFEQIR